MNPKALARDAGIVGVVTTLVIGAGVTAFAVAGLRQERDRLRAQAAPAPTVTVTATQAEQTPAPRTSHRTRTRTVVEAEPAGQPGTGDRPTAGTDRSNDGASSSTDLRPAPAPSTIPPPRQPSGCAGAVAVRLPLGMLPQCTITIGGSR